MVALRQLRAAENGEGLGTAVLAKFVSAVMYLVMGNGIGEKQNCIKWYEE